MLSSFRKTLSDFIRTPLVLFFIISLVGMVIEFLVFNIYLGTGSSLKVRILLGTCESALLLIPLWLLNGRWRWIVVAGIWLLSLFYVCNIVYYAFWNDLIPLSLIFSPASYNSLVFKSGFGALPVNIALCFGLVPIVVTATFIILKISSVPSLRFKHKMFLTVVTLLLYVSGVLLCIESCVLYWRANNINTSFAKEFVSHFNIRSSSRRHTYNQRGLPIYLVIQLINEYEARPIRLSDEEHRELDSFCSAIPLPACEAFSQNTRKNLIFIVVESLNAWAVGAEYDGHKVTPVMDSLINAPGTISCLSVIPQVKDGGSSDGQFIYNTGLLPIREGVTVNVYGNNRFCSLVGAMGYENSCEYIVESGEIWNHYTTNRSYGYSRIIDDMEVTEGGQDATMFRIAYEDILTMPQPFTVELVTLSMHAPFIDPQSPRYKWIDELPDIDNLRRDYLQVTHDFDRLLGQFLEKLNQNGILENSVVVLASDHDQYSSDAEYFENDIYPIVFMALNTGINRKVERTVGQVDVFPTVLQIMNRLSGWHGVGISILDERNASAVDSRGELHGSSGTEIDNRKFRAYQISDSIIRSNHFLVSPTTTE